MKHGKSIWGMYKPLATKDLPTPNPGIRQDYINFLNSPEVSTPSAVGWYRIVQPLDELAKHGWKTDHRFGYPYPRDEDWNIVTIQMADNPAGIDLIDMLLDEGNKIVHEIDDNIFRTNQTRWDKAISRTGLTFAEIARTNRVVSEKSHMLTVTTPYLAEVMKYETGHGNIKILPNYVPEAVTKLVHNKKDKLVVGWAGGDSHEPDLQLIINVVADFLQKHQEDAEFHLIGEHADLFDNVFTRRHLEDKTIFPGRHTPWIRLDHSMKYYRSIDFDIALIPLADGEFEMSKSPIKAIEAMALGIPVIASDHEVYRGTVIDGVTGFLVKSSEEFAARLEELANDELLRDSMGSISRELAKAYTIEANWQKYDAAYGELV